MVVQLQYLVWPDKSTPHELWSLLTFRRRVRSLLNSASFTGGPLLVHCSAGVGRTGTFIALDMLLKDADETSQVDIFNTVKHLRQRRMSTVQVKVMSIHLTVFYGSFGNSLVRQAVCRSFKRTTKYRCRLTEYFFRAN
jgi:protein tyrosine phosphatase